jgi:hypothetical protein
MRESLFLRAFGIGRRKRNEEKGGQGYTLDKSVSLIQKKKSLIIKGSTMTRPLRISYHGAFYHITSRGNERKDIFENKRDRESFLFYLRSATLRLSNFR